MTLPFPSPLDVKVKDEQEVSSENDILVINEGQLLGKGAFSSVYLGTFRTMKVAIKKVLILNQETDREQSAMSQLNHCNVLKLVHVEDNVPFRCFVLELCAATLDDYCRNKYRGEMPTEHQSLLDMARGLAHIHSNRLVHRDIKPENVLISFPDAQDNIVLKISDFGLCKSTNERGTFSTSRVKGTPLFLAPEVLRSLDIGKFQDRSSLSTDVFALGCTFFYFLTKGSHPFGSSIFATANIVCGNYNLSEISEYRTVRLIEKMIRFQPDKRPKIHEVVCRLSELEAVAHSFRSFISRQAIDKERKQTLPRSANTLQHFPRQRSLEENKTYSHLITDADFHSKCDKPTSYLMFCLRSRIRLELVKSFIDQRETAIKGSAVSLYDTLLNLLHWYEGAEICRLLLWRQHLVPLFLPTDQHHMPLLRVLKKYYLKKENYMRVAVISCRSKEHSQTTELLSEVFHIDSLHRKDLDTQTVTKQNTLPEIGIGYITAKNHRNCKREMQCACGYLSAEKCLVLHVVGSFEPLWDLIVDFSDYLIVEESSNENESFHNRRTTKKYVKGLTVWTCTDELFKWEEKRTDGGPCSYLHLQSPVNASLNEFMAGKLLSGKKIISCFKGNLYSLLTKFHFANQYLKAADLPVDYLLNCLCNQKPLVLNGNDVQWRKLSLYDTLLNLLQEYDTAGRVEIFRLLLERSSMIPLFLPNWQHHMSMLHFVSENSDLPTNMSDPKLLRVAVVSCRQIHRSQTAALLRELLHVESIHLEDAKNGDFTLQSTIAELGLGFIKSESINHSDGCEEQNCSCPKESEITNCLVLHVIGNFELFVDFISEFSDYLIIEDSIFEWEAFYQRDLTSINDNSWRKETDFVIWKPYDTRVVRRWIGDQIYGFPALEIYSSFSEALCRELIQDITEQRRKKLDFHRKPLSDLTLPSDKARLQFQDGACSIQTNIESAIKHFAATDVFLLQKNFLEQCSYEDQKDKHLTDEDKLNELEMKVKDLILKRREISSSAKNHQLISCLMEILQNQESSSRLLGFNRLQHCLNARHNESFPKLRHEIDRLNQRFYEAGESEDKKYLAGQLRDANKNYLRSLVTTDHIWREMSHIYATDNGKYRSYPQTAAQHLMDGVCLELLDGDSNMVNLPWIQAILTNVEQLFMSANKRKARIFVLSVLGEQGSGKSTLLNVMFGIRMKTGPMKCTRGIIMQLVPVADRQQYDYILILDTEGLRAAEYFDSEDGHKRDNRLATISILLADATVVVVSNDNDSAIKAILPIVLLVYQHSHLAEERGGHLSSIIFLVYNRISCMREDHLNTIRNGLSTSLSEASNELRKQNETASAIPCIRLDPSNPKESDARILGNIHKETEPPNDVPNEDYGEALADFRQYIHQRLTTSNSGQWSGKTLSEFVSYLKSVWKCIVSADFLFTFKSIVERNTFEQINAELKACERQLSDEYRSKFEAIERDILIMKANSENTNKIEQFQRQLADEVQATKCHLDEETKAILTKPGRDKWKADFQELWLSHKKEQENHWNGLLEQFIDCHLRFSYWVNKYQRHLRERIRKRFSEKPAGKVTDKEEDTLFTKCYNAILNEAQSKHLTIDVYLRVKNVYRTSKIIQLIPAKISERETDPAIDAVIKDILNDADADRTKLVSLSSTIAGKLEKWLKTRSKSKKELERQVDIYAQLLNQIFGWLQDKYYYVDSIVDEMIGIVESVVKARKYTKHSEQRDAHVFAKVLVTKYMTKVQKEWEDKNSVYNKLRDASFRKEMKAYFQEVFRGALDVKLFPIMLEANLKKTVPEAFEEEMILLVVDKVSTKKWLVDSRSFFYNMDMRLIKLINKGKVESMLDNIKESHKFYEHVLNKLIAEEYPDVEKEWQEFSKELGQMVQYAVSAAELASSERAKKFANELIHQTFKFRNNVLAKSLKVSSDEYGGCDTVGSQEFVDSFKQLIPAIGASKPFTDGPAWCSALNGKILSRMREKRVEETAAARCSAPCPLCKSLCILPFGHGSRKKHDTFHQPRGLTGGHWSNKHSDERKKNTLCAHSCSTATNTRFRHKGEWYAHREFATVFPDWLEPNSVEELPLRQYIFATYNDDIAAKYNKRPSVDIPASYYHNLDNIRLDLQMKLTSEG